MNVKAGSLKLRDRVRWLGGTADVIQVDPVRIRWDNGSVATLYDDTEVWLEGPRLHGPVEHLGGSTGIQVGQFYTIAECPIGTVVETIFTVAHPQPEPGEEDPTQLPSEDTLTKHRIQGLYVRREECVGFGDDMYVIVDFSTGNEIGINRAHHNVKVLALPATVVPPMDAVPVVRLEPGSILIVTVDMTLSTAYLKMLRKWFAEHVWAKVLLAPTGTKLTVLNGPPTGPAIQGPIAGPPGSPWLVGEHVTIDGALCEVRGYVDAHVVLKSTATGERIIRTIDEAKRGFSEGES